MWRYISRELRRFKNYAFPDSGITVSHPFACYSVWKVENASEQASRLATLSNRTTLAGFAQIFLSENSLENSAVHTVFLTTRSITFSMIAPGTITHAERLRLLPSGTLQLTVNTYCTATLVSLSFIYFITVISCLHMAHASLKSHGFLS